MGEIRGFFGDNRWLSNFARAPVVLDGLTYPTVEHAYQAAKTQDTEVRRQIQQAPRPSDAKRLGKLLRLRPDWERVREGVMLDLLQQKFTQPQYCALLRATADDVIIEENTWGDTYWGVCRGKGLNRLGNLLMTVRQELAVQED